MDHEKKNCNSLLVSSVFIKKYVITLDLLKLNKNSLEGGRTGSGFENTVHVLYIPLGNFEMHILGTLLTHSTDRVNTLVM